VNTREILKSRARKLSMPLSSQLAKGDSIEVVEFRLAHERYAVEQRYVREVCPLRQLTPLPCTPAFMAGIINARGQIVPVIDIKKFFELPETGITDLHVVVILHINNIELGLLADAVTSVRSVLIAELQPSLPTLTGIRAEYLKGIADDQVVILDAAKILADQKLVVNEEVENPVGGDRSVGL
jgi:purine-binding chemotaxis protein CheW